MIKDWPWFWLAYFYALPFFMMFAVLSALGWWRVRWRAAELFRLLAIGLAPTPVAVVLWSLFASSLWKTLGNIWELELAGLVGALVCIPDMVRGKKRAPLWTAVTMAAIATALVVVLLFVVRPAPPVFI